jgi:hypothetical protein
MRMKTYAFLAKTYTRKYMGDAKEAMKTLSAKLPKSETIKSNLAKKGTKIKKHIKKNKMKYAAGAGAAGGYTASKIKD